jgi:hypothetical protein
LLLYITWDNRDDLVGEKEREREIRCLTFGVGVGEVYLGDDRVPGGVEPDSVVQRRRR